MRMSNSALLHLTSMLVRLSLEVVQTVRASQDDLTFP